jgi:hypothetical protein
MNLLFVNMMIRWERELDTYHQEMKLWDMQIKMVNHRHASRAVATGSSTAGVTDTLQKDPDRAARQDRPGE